MGRRRMGQCVGCGWLAGVGVNATRVLDPVVLHIGMANSASPWPTAAGWWCFGRKQRETCMRSSQDAASRKSQKWSKNGDHSSPGYVNREAGGGGRWWLNWIGRRKSCKSSCLWPRLPFLSAHSVSLQYISLTFYLLPLFFSFVSSDFPQINPSESSDRHFQREPNIPSFMASREGYF